MSHSRKHRPGPAAVMDGLDEPVDTRIADLESVLAEKDELLTQLTARLEQAAEQLDRLRREGVQSASADTHSAHKHQSHIEDQPTLTADLQQMLQDWQGLQVDGWFGRLDLQLAELRDLVAQAYIPQSEPSDQATAEAPTSLADALSRMGEAVATARAESSQTRHALDGTWEATKAAMFAEDNPAGPEAASEDGEFDAPPTPVTEDFWLPTKLSLPDRPVAVDWSTTPSPEDLQQAIEQREEFIDQLLEHIQALELDYQGTRQVPDLGELTPEQQAQLEAWVTIQREQLRQTEVALSIERAQLSRDQRHLRREQELINKELKRLGVKKLVNEQIEEEEPSQVPTPAKRGWRGLFGPKK